tara:strand:- start:9350 stop:9565 length:216 start_codon:yes stop_codon:yes gene_type:complete
MKEAIEKTLVENIPDAVCKFYGDSCNLRLEVASKIFANMPLINQHKTVMKLLQNKFKSGELHALSLETKII